MVSRRKNRERLAGASSLPPQTIPAGAKIDHAKMLPGFRPLKTGWTPERLQRFFDVLRHTGCVLDACTVAGISDSSAYRMRGRFPAFAAAWDEALARSRIGLEAVAYRRAVEGTETVIIRKGEEVERRISPSDTLLALLLKRGDVAAGDAAAVLAGGKKAFHPDEVITYAEWKKGWRFDGDGRKDDIRSFARVKARLEAKFDEMRARRDAYAADGFDGER